MVTRKDVALRAGVSVTIVSRVLNNSGYVAKEKREAVLKAAKEMDYHPNPVAISLQTQKTKQILFYNKDLGNVFTIELYRGMIRYAQFYNYMVVLSGALDFDKIKNMMVDGIILPNATIACQYAKKVGKSFHLPVVSAAYNDSDKPLRHIPFIVSDTYKAMELLILHLREKGHERIALASPYELYSQKRHQAYIAMMGPVLKDKLEDYVFTCGRNWVYGYIEESFIEEGQLAAEEFIKRQSDATAVLCFNDDFAMGMIKRFEQMGFHVPNNISVVGIDGLYGKGMGSLFPDLTSVSLSPMEQGAECVRILLEMINGNRVKSRTYVPNRLHEGETVKALV